MERTKNFQTFDQSEYIFGRRFVLGGLDLDLADHPETCPGPEASSFDLSHRDSAPEESAE
jgi:hypothetical protein